MGDGKGLLGTEYSAKVKTLLDGWHWTKTLLASEPDVNQRHLYFGTVKVATFNRSMHPWSSENDRELNILCETLNENFYRRDEDA